MKKTLLIIALAAVIFLSATAGTLAYFTHEDTATNVITAGDVKISLEEKSKTDDGLVPFEDIDDVMPGAVVSKIVTVKNIGSQPAYIRISVESALTLAEGVTGEVDLSLVSLDIDTEHWTLRDGFYYYNEALEASAETSPLFTSVTFSPDMGNIYQHSKAEISVKAYAVQSANNGSGALDATGWPEV